MSFTEVKQNLNTHVHLWLTLNQNGELFNRLTVITITNNYIKKTNDLKSTEQNNVQDNLSFLADQQYFYSHLQSLLYLISQVMEQKHQEDISYLENN